MKSTDQCWNAITHLLRYLKGTWTCGIYYNNRNLNLYKYSDSSQADNLYNRQSTASYVFILNNEPISQSSQRQVTISISICEAKYIAQVESVCKAIWIRELLGELEILKIVIEDGYLKTISSHITIFANNQEVVKLIKNFQYHRKIKHIPIKYHKTRELIAKRVIYFE